ncbi:MAG: uncharacterized protein QOF78_4032 [Phycisphaerales bacterium]|nr:uncharacterized protein [Phycisphaerales bacterium]
MLDWLLITEAVVIACMGLVGLISLFMAKQDPNDPVYVFCRTFWNEFLFPPVVMSIDTGRMPSPVSRGGGGSSSRAEEASDDDEFYGRVQKDAQGRVQKVDLIVLVEPHAPSDVVVGRDGDGLKVQVAGEAGESRSNKALVEMVATAVGVKPFQVTLTKGHYQTRKTVQIQGVSPDEMQMRLASLPEAE